MSEVGWHCVQIEHERLGQPLDVTFRHMLSLEFKFAGEPADCCVYGRKSGPGAHIYYFSPGAYKVMKVFIEFWHAYECQEPKIAELEVII